MPMLPFYNPPKVISAYHDLSALVSDVKSIFGTVKKAFTCQVTVPGGTKAYSWCLRWLQDNTNISHNKDVILQKSRQGKDNFIPTNKPFYFSHNGNWLNVRTDKTEDTDSWKGGMKEVLIFSCLGKNNKPILEFIEAAENLYKKEEEEFNCFISHTDDGEWRRWSYRAKRSRDTVILPDNQMEGVIRDVDVFLSSKSRYLELGIPWRRGYLLYGPPGTGKSSLVPVLASEFDLSVHVVQVADINDSTLAALMNAVSPRSIVLMEDIDRALASDKKVLTQSGLFNAIDGASAGEGVILVMTTNNREDLDPALIRPGRIDYEVHFDILRFEEAARMYLKFYPGQVAEAKEFAKMAVEKKMTPAEAQGQLLHDYNVMDNLPVAV
jgi:chaperone BCS1